MSRPTIGTYTSTKPELIVRVLPLMLSHANWISAACGAGRAAGGWQQPTPEKPSGGGSELS